MESQNNSNELKKNNNKKKKTALFILSALVISGIIIGILYYNYLKYNISTDDAYVEGAIHLVSPKIAGTILNVYVNDNQQVKKGDVLVTLDPKDFDIKIENAKASLDLAANEVSSLYASLSSAGARVKIAEASYKQSFIDFKRYEQLYKEGVISADLIDKSKTALNVAYESLKSAKEELRKIKALVGADTKKGKEALIRQKEAVLKEALIQKEYTTIAAPSDGYVTKKSVEKGNYVYPGQPVLAVVLLNEVWVIANYKETQVTNIKKNQKVKIKVDTYPDKTFYGRVDSIMAGTGATFSLIPSENATGNFVKVVQRIPVKIVLDKTADAYPLRPGMSVIPTIMVKE